MLTSRETIALAERIIRDGKPITVNVHHDGDAENGPFSVEYKGYRLGQLKLELHRGDVVLTTDRPDPREVGGPYEGAPMLWRVLRQGITRQRDFRVARIKRAIGGPGFASGVSVYSKATRAERRAAGRALHNGQLVLANWREPLVRSAGA